MARNKTLSPAKLAMLKALSAAPGGHLLAPVCAPRSRGPVAANFHRTARSLDRDGLVIRTMFGATITDAGRAALEGK